MNVVNCFHNQCILSVGRVDGLYCIELQWQDLKLKATAIDITVGCLLQPTFGSDPELRSEGGLGWARHSLRPQTTGEQKCKVALILFAKTWCWQSLCTITQTRNDDIHVSLRIVFLLSCTHTHWGQNSQIAQLYRTVRYFEYIQRRMENKYNKIGKKFHYSRQSLKHWTQKDKEMYMEVLPIFNASTIAWGLI